MDSVPGYRGHTWAPDIIYHNGLWHLYYSCSTFGKNGSAIGHAVNKTLDPASPNFKWEDKGVVIVSHRNIDNWNAIDPNVIIDKRGCPYMAYGSFWDGIQLVQLSEQDMQTPITKPVTIARRLGKAVELDKIKFAQEPAGVIEAPFIIKRGKYYYLFLSFDYCCRGENSTYKTVYGRSKKITGPFFDKEGMPMEYGGGSCLYGPDESNFVIGHCSVYEINGEYYFISHAYLKEHNGRSKLFVRKLKFDRTGWIIPQ